MEVEKDAFTTNTRLARPTEDAKDAINDVKESLAHGGTAHSKLLVLNDEVDLLEKQHCALSRSTDLGHHMQNVKESRATLVEGLLQAALDSQKYMADAAQQSVVVSRNHLPDVFTQEINSLGFNRYHYRRS